MSRKKIVRNPNLKKPYSSRRPDCLPSRESALLGVCINLKNIESEVKRRSLEENRDQALEDPEYAYAESVIRSGKWDNLYKAQALLARKYIAKELSKFLSRAIDRSIERVLEEAKTCTSEDEFLDLYMGGRNLLPPNVLQAWINHSPQVTRHWMYIHAYRKRSPRFDLSAFRENYYKVYPMANQAIKVYKANKHSARWKDHVITEVPDMPAYLVRRVSGNPQDLTEKDRERLSIQGGDSIASDIAYEWAAWLCGAPEYAYRLNSLQDILTKQNTEYRNQSAQKTQQKNQSS